MSVDLSTMPWLQYDWNQDGNHNESQTPDATIKFQQYRGHDRILYWRPCGSRAAIVKLSVTINNT